MARPRGLWLRTVHTEPNPLQLHAGRRDVRSVLEAIADRVTLDLCAHRLQVRIVGAENYHAIGRNAVGKLHEGRFQIVKITVRLEVLAIDVCDHREPGREFQERSVALICLGYQVLASAKLGVAAERTDAPADDGRRIEACHVEDDGNHRRGGRLTVRTCDGNSVTQPHELGEQFGSRNDGEAALAGGHQLGIR